MAWSNGPQGSRLAPLPANWPQLRTACFERDGYRCTWYEEGRGRCTTRADECDHWRGRGDHRLVSLRSICHFHHARQTAQQAAAGRTSMKRPDERHPSGPSGAIEVAPYKVMGLPPHMQ